MSLSWNSTPSQNRFDGDATPNPMEWRVFVTWLRLKPFIVRRGRIVRFRSRPSAERPCPRTRGSGRFGEGRLLTAIETSDHAYQSVFSVRKSLTVDYLASYRITG